jgi:DNA mismatch repair protein MSH6
VKIEKKKSAKIEKKKKKNRKTMSLLRFFAKQAKRSENENVQIARASSSSASTSVKVSSQIAAADAIKDEAKIIDDAVAADDDDVGVDKTKHDNDDDNDNDNVNDDDDVPLSRRGGGAAEKERRAALASAKLSNAKANAMRARYSFLDDPHDEHGRARADPAYDPTTLRIPASAWADMTEFERSFWAVKRKHFDCVIFFRKGKFYELFEADAELGVRELGLKISQRGNMRLAGVPINYFNEWAKKLLLKGYKIGRVDEVESKVALAKRKRDGDAVGDKSVMKRELVQILTPSTLVDEELLTTQYENHLLALVEWQRDAALDAEDTPELQFGVCFIDASIGTFHIAKVADDSRRLALQTLLLRALPKEVLHFGLSSGTVSLLRSSLKSVPLVHVDRAHLLTAGEFKAGAALAPSPLSAVPRPDDASGGAAALQWLTLWCKQALPPLAAASSLVSDALLLAISYLRHCMLDAQLIELAEFSVIDSVMVSGGGGGGAASSEMQLDGQTVLNLELLRNTVDGGREGTLLHLLDDTSTAFGKRLLPRWVTAPLTQLAAVRERQAAVREFATRDELASDVAHALGKLPDLERLLTRVKNKSMTVKDLKAFVAGLDGAAAVGRLLAVAHRARPLESQLLAALAAVADAPPLAAVVADIVAQFDGEALQRDSLLVPNAGVDAEYDKCRDAVTALQQQLDAVCERARQELSCAAVAFGDAAATRFELVVPQSALRSRALPAQYKQTSSTKQVVRCRTAELERLVPLFEEATDELRLAQQGALGRQLQRIAVHAHTVAGQTATLARVDCLLSLASASRRNGFACMPELLDASALPHMRLRVQQCRHPTLAQASEREFIANDVELGTEARPQSVVLLTGPNMGGKSTVMRQACLMVVLAQIGCFVPAQQYVGSVVDRIFTRIGAQDNILTHQSTFMCELQETCAILQHATPHSFVVLDELGRGTSTFDGLAIASAVLAHLADKVRCGAIFSTHYHQLTRDAAHERAATIRCMHMDARVERGRRDVTFLYRLVDGICPQSYGMHVAAMADVPAPVVEQAERISAQMETLFEFGKLAVEANH